MTVGELEYGRGTPMTSIELVEWRAFWGIKNDEHAHRKAQAESGMG